MSIKVEKPYVQVYRYSTLLSYCLERFMDDNREYIVEENGVFYIFAKTYKVKFLMNTFMDYIEEFFSINNNNPIGMNFTAVVGTCYSYHNWRVKYKSELESDEKHKNKTRIIRHRLPLRYVISDRQFVTDEEMLNVIFDNMLNEYITQNKIVYTSNYQPVRWIFIKNMTEDDMIKLIKDNHSNVKEYPLYENNFIQDLNSWVYSSIIDKYKMNEKDLFNSMFIYTHMMEQYERES